MTRGTLPFAEKELLSFGWVTGQVGSRGMSIERVEQLRHGFDFVRHQIECRHARPGDSVVDQLLQRFDGLVADADTTRQLRPPISAAAVRTMTTGAAFHKYRSPIR